MEAIQGINKILSNSPAAGLIKTAAKTANSGGDFNATLKALLSPDKANKVSEEELFSALVQERIKKTKGESALSEFNTLFESAKKRLQKPDGFVPLEDAAKQALKELRDSQKISKEEADSIFSQAFAAAQLDQNKEALFDNRGGPNDPTMAVAQMEQALLLSGTLISQFDSGAEKAATRSLDEPGTLAATAAGGAYGSEASGAGFLFKPVSESDGKLVVLLPPRLTGLVQGLSLVGPNGEVIESGRYTGNGNGGREHFRFSRAGAQYPDGAMVQATLATGELVRYIIRETSQRTENIQPEGSQAPGSSKTSAGPKTTAGDDTPQSL
jgi:hypothetical protein